MATYFRIEEVTKDSFPSDQLSMIAMQCVYETTLYKNDESLCQRILRDRFRPALMNGILAWLIPASAHTMDQVRASAKPVINLLEKPEAAIDLCQRFVLRREEEGTTFIQMQRYNDQKAVLYGLAFGDVNRKDEHTEVLAEVWGDPAKLARMACCLLINIHSDNGYVEFHEPIVF